MGIRKRAFTEMTCDVCGERIIAFNSWLETGWLKHFARCEGATCGKRHVCRECRIKEKIERCGLIKRHGEAGRDGIFCMGFGTERDDEPCSKCKKCIACTSFDWDEERARIEESLHR